MKIKDYARAAEVLRAARVEFNQRRVENRFFLDWMSLNGTHGEFVWNISAADARILARTTTSLTSTSAN